MTNFNNNWKFQKEIETRDGSFLRRVIMTKQKDRYIAFFGKGPRNDERYYKHEVMKMKTKKTGKPFMMFSTTFKEMPENFEPKPINEISYDEILEIIKPGYKFYTLIMTVGRNGRKKYWLIDTGEEVLVFIDSFDNLRLADDLDKYYIEKHYKGEPIEKARWETYTIRECFEEIDMVLDFRYQKYQTKTRELMKTEFLEELVQYVCHPSRVETFEGLGFFDQ